MHACVHACVYVGGSWPAERWPLLSNCLHTSLFPTEAGLSSGSCHFHASKLVLNANQKENYDNVKPATSVTLVTSESPRRFKMICHFRKIPPLFQSEEKPHKLPPKQSVPLDEHCSQRRYRWETTGHRLLLTLRPMGALARPASPPIPSPCGPGLGLDSSCRSQTLIWDPTGGTRDCLGQ